MSLNSSSWSMTHRAKQQSMNAQRRNKNALKNDSKLNEVDELLEILPHSDNIKSWAHSEIIHILDGKKNNRENYIFPIKNFLDENLIQRVEKWTYFEVWGKLYRVTDTLFTKWWIVEAKEVHPQNSDDIFARHTFTIKEVLHNMIPENEAHTRIAQLILESKPWKKDFSGIYESIMDRAWRIMADVD